MPGKTGKTSGATKPQQVSIVIQEKVSAGAADNVFEFVIKATDTVQTLCDVINASLEFVGPMNIYLPRAQGPAAADIVLIDHVVAGDTVLYERRSLVVTKTEKETGEEDDIDAGSVNTSSAVSEAWTDADADVDMEALAQRMGAYEEVGGVYGERLGELTPYNSDAEADVADDDVALSHAQATDKPLAMDGDDSDMDDNDFSIKLASCVSAPVADTLVIVDSQLQDSQPLESQVTVDDDAGDIGFELALAAAVEERINTDTATDTPSLTEDPYSTTEDDYSLAETATYSGRLYDDEGHRVGEPAGEGGDVGEKTADETRKVVGKERNKLMTAMGRAMKSAPPQVHAHFKRMIAALGDRKTKDSMLRHWLSDATWGTVVAEEVAFEEEQKQNARRHRWMMAWQLEKDFPEWYVTTIKTRARADPSLTRMNPICPKGPRGQQWKVYEDEEVELTTTGSRQSTSIKADVNGDKSQPAQNLKQAGLPFQPKTLTVAAVKALGVPCTPRNRTTAQQSPTSVEKTAAPTTARVGAAPTDAAKNIGGGDTQKCTTTTKAQDGTELTAGATTEAEKVDGDNADGTASTNSRKRTSGGGAGTAGGAASGSKKAKLTAGSAPETISCRQKDGSINENTTKGWMRKINTDIEDAKVVLEKIKKTKKRGSQSLVGIMETDITEADAQASKVRGAWVAGEADLVDKHYQDARPVLEQLSETLATARRFLGSGK
eukprot:TRINITY_DN6587_c0_g1_i1.p1 TRINITY_DN6587_c0_g1~~TRINITY_DN6587_c0_g1_i1.p1  ORF type:complete len:720 (-),score=166.62 TRINITY_DN6587_c0_g1_i1:187-2346(-)